MNSQISENYISCFRRLPEAVQLQARKSYKLWRENPSHPGLHFKKIHGHENLYSVRVSKGWRTLGLLEADLITWFWIGSHAEYDKLIEDVVARSIILEESGSHFDPDIVEAFRASESEFQEIRSRFKVESSSMVKARM